MITTRMRRLSTAVSTVSVSSPSSWKSWVASTTTHLAERKILRELRAMQPIVGDASRARMANGEYTVFAANDYLGLSAHPDVRAVRRRRAVQRLPRMRTPVRGDRMEQARAVACV